MKDSSKPTRLDTLIVVVPVTLTIISAIGAILTAPTDSSLLFVFLALLVFSVITLISFTLWNLRQYWRLTPRD
jgi:hypothetical protein